MAAQLNENTQIMTHNTDINDPYTKLQRLFTYWRHIYSDNIFENPTWVTDFLISWFGELALEKNNTLKKHKNVPIFSLFE